jgi:hypothetical protein
MTTENFGFYFQSRLIQTSQTGGQQYSDTSPFSIPWLIMLSYIDSGDTKIAIDLKMFVRHFVNYRSKEEE